MSRHQIKVGSTIISRDGGFSITKTGRKKANDDSTFSLSNSGADFNTKWVVDESGNHTAIVVKHGGAFLTKKGTLRNKFSKKFKQDPDTGNIADISSRHLRIKLNPINEQNGNLVRTALNSNNLLGKTVRVLYVTDGTIHRDVEYDVPSVSISQWWDGNDFRSDWIVDSDTTIFQNEPNGSLIFLPATNISTQFITQFFLNSLVQHCVLDPIKDWIQDNLKNQPEPVRLSPVKNRKKGKLVKTAQRKTWEAKLNKVEKYLNVYVDGIPENKMLELCEDLDITVKNRDFLVEKFNDVYNPGSKKAFVFINTRMNHMHPKNFSDQQVYETDDLNQVLEILTENQQEGLYYQKAFNGSRISAVCCPEGKFITTEDFFKEALEEFWEVNNLSLFKISEKQEPNLYKFAHSAVKWNNSTDFNTMTDEKIEHIDGEKSYANCSSCPYYSKFQFPTKYTQFRTFNHNQDQIKPIIERYPGVYRIVNLQFPESEHKPFLISRWRNGIWPAPDLAFLRDQKATYTVTTGFYCDEKFDLKWPESCMKNIKGNTDKNHPKIYALLGGILNKHKPDEHFYVPNGTGDFASVLQNNGYKTRFYEDKFLNEETDESEFTGEICLKVPKPNGAHGYFMQGSYILSYTRINTALQVLNIPFDKLLRVGNDDIYFHETPFTMNKNFRHKPHDFRNKTSDNHGKFKNSKGTSGIIHKYTIPKQSFVKIISRVSTHTGPPGTGKSYGPGKDLGYVGTKVVSAMAWKRSKTFALLDHPESNFVAEVKQTLLGIDDGTFKCKSHYEYFHPSLIVLEEGSNWTEKEVDQTIKLFPYTAIIIAGDFDYDTGRCFQTTPIKGPLININNKQRTVCTRGKGDHIQYTTDWRCINDPEMAAYKVKVREIMLKDDYKNMGEFIDKCLSAFHRPNQIISREDAIRLAKITDYPLGSTKSCQKCKKVCTCPENKSDKIFWDTQLQKKYNQKKWVYTKNFKTHYKHEIHIGEKPAEGNTVESYFNTIHAIQGDTIEHHKVFIDCNSMFEDGMFNSAMSRVKHSDQLFFVF